jgi:hypothetical protein
MENVNDILKRQLLLMKFDSGVTLKENYEKVSGKKSLINEEKIGDVEVSYKRDTLKLINDFRIESTTDSDDLKLFSGTMFVKRDDTSLIATNIVHQFVTDFTGRESENTQGDVTYFCNEKQFRSQSRNQYYKIDSSEDGTTEFNSQKAFDNLCHELPGEETTANQEAGNTEQKQSGDGYTHAKQGWTMESVKIKFPCLSDNDFAWNNVMNDGNGDVVKLNLGKNKNGQDIYGKLYLQDGYMNLWDSPYTKVGADNYYMTCNTNGKLGFMTGQNFYKTNSSTKGPQMESVNKFGKLIKEAIDLEVINAVGGVGGSETGKTVDSPPRAPRTPRPKVDVTPLVKEVQNKLKELDPTAVVSGTMDQETINKIMLQINKLVEKQDKEAEAKRIEDERVAAIKSVDSVVSGSGGGY